MGEPASHFETSQAACNRRLLQLRELASDSLAQPDGARRAAARPLLDCVFEHLEDSGRLAAFQQQPRQRHHLWDWEELHRDARLAIGLLRVYRHDPIPLHDHPGSTGVQVTLMGRLHTEQFNLAEDDSPDRHTTRLERVSSATLKPGAISCFTPGHGSVHSLRSETAHSIQCCLLFDPYRESERRWFFPLYRAQQQAGHIDVSSIRRNMTQGGFGR